MSNILSEGIFRARKRHICDGCHSRIERGEVYHSRVCVGKETPYAWCACHRCSWIITHLYDKLNLHNTEYNYKTLEEYHCMIPQEVNTYTLLVNNYINKIKQKILKQKIENDQRKCSNAILSL